MMRFSFDLLKGSSKRKGFTLIELLVVVTLILISSGVAGDIVISIIRTYNKTRIFNEIEQNGNYVLAKVEHDLRNATEITAPVTVPTCSNAVGGRTETLTLTQRDATNSLVTVNYRISSVDQSGNPCSGTCAYAIQRCVGSNANCTSGSGGVRFDPMINVNFKEGVQLRLTPSAGTVPYAGFCQISSDPKTIRISFELVQSVQSAGGIANQATQAFSRIVVLRFVD